jgi:hypothetical protein
MLTKDKANRLQSSGWHPKSLGKRVPVRPRGHWVEAGGKTGKAARDAQRLATEKLLVEAAMFPETDEISNILSDTVMVLFKRRLVDRVLRLWIEISRGGRFPRRDQIEPSMLGEDWANCLVIAVRSPIQLSYFVAVGENLSFAHCPNDSLAGVLLSHLPQVLSERRCLMIEGRATLRGSGVLYRSALFPLSEDGVAIDHVLGAANHRLLRENEELLAPLIRTKWL